MSSWVGYEKLTPRRELKELHFNFTVDASGVATVVPFGSRVSSVAKISTGKYKCLLSDVYVALVSASVMLSQNTVSDLVESHPVIDTTGTNVATATAANRFVQINFYADNSDAWALADPVSRTVYVHLVLSNSTS